jgi:membrane associated rhomboid family serine protease
MSNSIIDDIKFNLKTGNNVLRFIIINSGIFILLGLLSLFDNLFKLGGLLQFHDYFTFPSSLVWWLRKPWSLLTYMFLHRDLFHLLGNMLMLYFGGRIFTDFLGNQRIVALYFGGGIAGALLYMLLYNTIPMFADAGMNANLIGSSAAVLAIFFAIASYLPNYEVSLILIGPVRLKYIALFLFILDLLSIDKSNPGGHIAHIGGALFGIAYASGLRKGYDFTSSFNKMINKLGNLFSQSSKNKDSNMKVAYKQAETQKAKAAKVAKNKQEIIDAILDKISKSGYDSLTKEEQETIFKMSKED